MSNKKRRAPKPRLEIESEGDDVERRPSKSAVKRELAAVADLARELVALPASELAKLPLNADTHEAISAAAALANRARQRQFRYACGVLAREDVDAIKSALAHARRPHVADVRAMHDAEGWRDRLLAGDTALADELALRYSDLDPRHLKSLIAQALTERDRAKPVTAARQLFRYLHQFRIVE